MTFKEAQFCVKVMTAYRERLGFRLLHPGLAGLRLWSTTLHGKTLLEKSNELNTKYHLGVKE